MAVLEVGVEILQAEETLGVEAQKAPFSLESCLEALASELVVALRALFPAI